MHTGERFDEDQKRSHKLRSKARARMDARNMWQKKMPNYDTGCLAYRQLRFTSNGNYKNETGWNKPLWKYMEQGEGAASGAKKQGCDARTRRSCVRQVRAPQQSLRGGNTGHLSGLNSRHTGRPRKAFREHRQSSIRIAACYVTTEPGSRIVLCRTHRRIELEHCLAMPACKKC